MPNDHLNRPQLDPPELPEIDANLCVQALVVEASCRACVEACPHDAWVMDDDGLGLDTSACDGCAICVAACPQTAITLSRPAPATMPDDPATALVACEIAAPAGGKGVIACLHAVALDELAGLHQRGVRSLLVGRGDCTTCSRGKACRFDRDVAALGRMLAERQQPPLEIPHLSPATWLSRQAELSRPSRRGLFNVFRSGAVQTADADARSRRPAAIALSNDAAAVALVPFAVRLDVSACETCDACARICPTGAITLRQADPGATITAAYVVDSRHCTGCRLCVDVCNADAVALAPWANTSITTTDLDTAQCTACGNVYQVIAGRSSATPKALCRICAATRHSRNLFQVLK